MDEKGFVEGMREYIAQLNREKRYSSAKSYQDALNSFIRYSGTDCIAYSLLIRIIFAGTRLIYWRTAVCAIRFPLICGVCVVSITKRWRTVRRNLFPLYSRGFLRVWKVSVRSPCLSRITPSDDSPGGGWEAEKDTVGALLDVSVWGYVFR